jgi:hypothetical protein
MLEQWPSIPFAEWRDTRETLHRYAQIVGKIQLALTPVVNHFWNVTLRVTARGLATSALFCDGVTFDLELDFVRHELVIRTSDGAYQAIQLESHSVADFHREVFAALNGLGIHVHIWDQPVEIQTELIPFHEDTMHATYNREHVSRFFRALTSATQVLQEFRAQFVGKCSDVAFYWGTFDLSVARFSGRPSPNAPTSPPYEREGYSHEVNYAGFWPGDTRYPAPAFFAAHYPSPPGFTTAVIHPPEASWQPASHSFVLPYDTCRDADGASRVLTFCQSAYETGATLATWDREALERH